jgi:adenylate kinase family enzyme
MQQEMMNNTHVIETSATIMILGPSGSGKTVIAQKIIDERNILFDKEINRIVFSYEKWQPKYDELKEKNSLIEFHQGLFDIEKFNKNDNNLLIIDDLTYKCEKDENIKNLFTTDSHHMNINVILLGQNIFSSGKYFRTMSLNSDYLILTNNPRDRQQISRLASQMFPKNNQFLVEAYNDATTINKYGYLFLDLTQTTDQMNRVQTGIFKKLNYK